MAKVRHFFEKLQKLVNGITGLMLIAIMVIIFVQTFTRYVIFYSIPWSEEASRYLFVGMILLGINLGISQDLMVRIDLIDNFLSSKVKYFLEIGRQTVALVIAVVFFISTFDMIRIGKYQLSPALRLPMNVMYGTLCVGFLLAVAAVIFKLADIVKGGKETCQHQQSL